VAEIHITYEVAQNVISNNLIKILDRLTNCS